MDFPESTCPMTTMLMCVFSFPMLAGYAWRAGGGGGCGGAAAFLGRLQGEKARVSRAPLPSAASPAHRGQVLLLSTPLDHAPQPSWGVPGLRLAALPVLGQIQATPGGGWPGYFWPPCPASDPQQDATVSGLPSTTLPETPGSQGCVTGASKVPFPRGKSFPHGSLPLPPLPSRSFQAPGHLLRFVGVLGGAVGARPCRVPSPPPLPKKKKKPCVVRVTARCPQSGADKNSPQPQGIAGQGTARAGPQWGIWFNSAALNLDKTEGGG